MAEIYVLLIFYPFISLFINKYLLDNQGELLVQIASEWYLFFACILFYIGLIIIFFFGTKTPFSAFLAYILFTIFYFAISISRKTIFTNTTT